MNVGSLIYPRAAGYSPASLIAVSICDQTTYNTKSGGGGNCTRVSNDASYFSKATCENRCSELSETCRDDAALREPVASWHRLTPSGCGLVGFGFIEFFLVVIRLAVRGGGAVRRSRTPSFSAALNRPFHCLGHRRGANGLMGNARSSRRTL